MGDDPLGIDDEDGRKGNAVPRAAPRKSLVDQAEGADDFGLFVGQQRESDVLGGGEAGMYGDRFPGDDRDVVTEGFELIEAPVPGDRLADAMGSPVE